jgi:hypothetical protein
VVTAASSLSGAQGLATIRARSGSNFFELDQRAAEILGVQKDHGQAMSPRRRLAVPKHRGALRDEVRDGGFDDPSPSGCSSSILLLGSSTKTVVTP